MIVFGTDGWRGIIARDFTYENVRLVAYATAKYLKDKVEGVPSVVIGYDTRFMSREFAEESAMVLAEQDIIVHLADNISSTPQVSFHTKQKGADLGVVITASHNPPEYNGYKLKGSFGGPALPAQIADVEAELKPLMAKPPKFALKTMDEYIAAKKIRMFDAKESYVRNIKKKIKVEEIKEAGFKVLYDPMHGAGIDTMHMLLDGVDEIHSDWNPGFGNLDHPEPIQECLGDLIDKMKKGNYDIGIATDGDADRIGAVDADGNFVDSHKIYMILLKYLYEVRKKRGSVAKTVSLTSMVNKFCEKHGINLIETAVGFKYIAELMVSEKLIIGGEESGGLGTCLHIPERDGLFNAFLLMEVMAVQKKSLKELCEDLDREFGMHRYMRRDVKVTPQLKKAILSACEKTPKKIGRYDVIKADNKDGFKFFVDGGWLLIRASGTEPLIRFYSEAESLSKVNELLDEGMKLKAK
jgi:phosphomannomutase